MEKDMLHTIEESVPKMSKSQKRIATYIISHFDKAAYMTASELGKEVGVSESTVVRFASAVGMEGYPEFTAALREALRQKLTASQRVEVANSRLGDGSVLDSVLSDDAERIRSTLENIDRADFDRAVETILSAGRIYILGMRSSYSIAAFLHYYLSLIFDNVTFVRSAGSSEILEQLARVGEGDAVIAVSFPRYSSRIVDAVSFSASRGADVIALTDSAAAPIAEYASSVLTARSDMASFADSLVAPMSVINAMIAAIGRKRQPEISLALDNLESVWERCNVYQKSSESNN
jgi:DNA-binding MurR/RpiR family transcriptional regulator